MVQILPEVPSFGAALARGLGSGLGKGLTQAEEFAEKLAIKKAARNPYEELQQSRLAADSLFKQYSTRIKELQSYLSSGMYGKGEAEGIREGIKKLQSERDELFGWSQKGEEQKEKEIKKEESKKNNKLKKKEKFNIKNPKHKARRDEVLKKTKNNKEEAEKILLMEYEL